MYVDGTSRAIKYSTFVKFAAADSTSTCLVSKLEIRGWPTHGSSRSIAGWAAERQNVQAREIEDKTIPISRLERLTSSLLVTRSTS